MADSRTEMVSIRLTPAEHAKAAAVAEHYALNIAQLVRMLLAKEARETGVSIPPSKR